MPAETKAKVEAKVASLREAVNNDDLEAMKSGIEALNTEAMAMGQAMYSQGAASPDAGASPGAGDGKSDGDNVVDAEFTDTDK